MPDDQVALGEMRRILADDGVAVLPVPIVREHTVEYPDPNPHDHYHVRAPGMDYFDRYRSVFSTVELYSSRDAAEIHQAYTHEDRSYLPTAELPFLAHMLGERYVDYAPICYAGSPWSSGDTG